MSRFDIQPAAAAEIRDITSFGDLGAVKEQVDRKEAGW